MQVFFITRTALLKLPKLMNFKETNISKITLIPGCCGIKMQIINSQKNNRLLLLIMQKVLTGHKFQKSHNLVTLTKQWEINNAHDDEKTLKKEIYTFFLKSVIIVRHCGPPKEWELIAKLRSAFPPVRLTIWGEGGV